MERMLAWQAICLRDQVTHSFPVQGLGVKYAGFKDDFPMLTPKILARTAALAFASCGGSAPALAEDCYSDWGLAGEIVRREKLVTVQQLTQANAAGLIEPIVKTTLCKDGDDYIYKLVVRDAKGQLKTVVVDARNPGFGAGQDATGSSAARAVKPR